MSLRLVGHIDLPEHRGSGGFDHAAIHHRADHLYVAHTANDALDIVDCARERYVGSIEKLPRVAGVLVSEARGLAFASNRGEDTVAIFEPGTDGPVAKVAVGRGPNGLAFDAGRGTLLAANLGDPGVPESCTISVIDVEARAMRAAIPVPGRTRWAIYDGRTDCFFVNINAPAVIVVVAAGDPTRIAKTYEVPAAGPHGLDLDPSSGRLYCACDAGQLVTVDAASGKALGFVGLSGAPDVVFLDAARERLYVAAGDPGVIDVIDTAALKVVERVPTEPGAHTTALDDRRGRLYVFLPATHRAALFVDE